MTGTHPFSFAVKPKVSGVEVDSELLRLLDLQLGLVVASLTGLASFETTTHHLSSFTVQIYVLGTYSWHTNFSIKAIISLLGIAFTPRAEKPLMTSSSASMKVFQQDAFHFHLKLPLLPLGSHREQFWAVYYIVDVCKWPAQWTAFWRETLWWWRTVVSYSRKRCKLRSTTERSAQIRGMAAPLANWVQTLKMLKFFCISTKQNPSKSKYTFFCN